MPAISLTPSEPVAAAADGRPLIRSILPGGVAISPLAWQPCPFAPMVSSGGGRWAGPLIRWWRDAPPEISQPALDHHCLVMHLGEPASLRRRGGEGELTAEVETGALSIAPAGKAFQWSASGPTDLAHIYLCPRLMQQVAVEELGREAGALELREPLGIRDPLLQTLFLEMLEQSTGTTRASRMYVDTLLRSLQLRLVRNHGFAPPTSAKTRHSIAPFRLRRVIEFVEANIAGGICLADLAAVAGSSPFHFSRAFTGAMGMPPYAYLLSRRIHIAKRLLVESDDRIGVIANQCGFNSAAQLSRMFKNMTGSTPLNFRADKIG